MISHALTRLTPEMVAEIEALAPRYPDRRALVLPALHIVNKALRHVPLDAVVDVANVLGLPPAEVQDTLSFYEFFHQKKPHGTVRAFVCRSVSCALRGGEELLEKLCSQYGIQPYGTTDDVGWKAAENPVSWHDFHATVLHLLGLDHEKLTFYHNGIQRRLTNVHGELITGILG